MKPWIAVAIKLVPIATTYLVLVLAFFAVNLGIYPDHMSGDTCWGFGCK
jgi:hypothetical protein